MLLAMVYGGYAALLGGLFSTYPAIVTCILAMILTLHSSLQHEIMHGHPFKRQWLNELMVLIPVGLFIPYHRFRDTHLAHHLDNNLTDPYDDPETAYHDSVRLHGYSQSHKALLAFNTTLLGRMLIGPALGLFVFYRQDLHAMRHGNKRIVHAYLIHAAGLALLLPLLLIYSQVSISYYLAACYLCMSLLKIRSYAEHKAHESVPGRIAVVESRGLLGWLFLFNNYHSVHHRFPGLAWFELPGVFNQDRVQWLHENQGNHFESYAMVFRRFLFKSREPVAHPLWSSDNRTQAHEVHSERD